MKVNSNIKIIGESVILVPYEEHHVPKYHHWMQSAELQTLTASEPLTLVEEYEMQKSWRKDDDKCTFIILDKEHYNNLMESSPETKEKNEIEAMIGDTNVFLKADNESGSTIGEIEIMIAEETSRGKGFGRQAVSMMLLYAVQFLNIRIFEVKISTNNGVSLCMFDKLEFVEVNRSEVFKEITLTRAVDDLWLNNLRACCKFTICPYGVS